MRKFVKIGAGVAFVALVGVNYMTFRQRDAHPAKTAVTPTPAPVRSEPVAKAQPAAVAPIPLAAPRAEPETTIPSEQLAPRVDPVFSDAQLRARSPIGRPISRPD